MCKHFNCIANHHSSLELDMVMGLGATTMRVSWLCLCVLLQLVLPTIRIAVSSGHVVETLPGYPGKLPFKLRTGYISVGDLDEIELFYYFVESQRNPSKDPVLLWLTGGPGCSAFSGLVYEIGPLTFDYATFDGGLPSFLLNNNSWTEVANVIFLDSPVGTGFSYSTTQEGYETSDTKSAEDVYQFMRKWFIAHPSYLNNPLYIAGDTYSGMIVPQVTYKLSEAITAGLEPIGKLQGYILGNPVTNLVADENSRMEFYFRVSIITYDLYESVKDNCNGEYVTTNTSNLECINDLSVVEECVQNLDKSQILEPACRFAPPKPASMKSLVDEDPPIEILQLPSQTRKELWCRNQNHILSYIWANDENVQRALHVRNGTISDWKRCNKTLAYDYNLESVVQLHLNLSSLGYRALIYSGDQDSLIPYLGTQRWIVSLNMTVTDSWRPWFVNGQVGGYTVKYQESVYAAGDGLTFATVKGAGHTAPEYKPLECLEILDRWLAFYAL